MRACWNKKVIVSALQVTTGWQHWYPAIQPLTHTKINGDRYVHIGGIEHMLMRVLNKKGYLRTALQVTTAAQREARQRIQPDVIQADRRTKGPADRQIRRSSGKMGAGAQKV
jgi:hypothetical protein